MWWIILVAHFLGDSPFQQYIIFYKYYLYMKYNCIQLILKIFSFFVQIYVLFSWINNLIRQKLIRNKYNNSPFKPFTYNVNTSTTYSISQQNFTKCKGALIDCGANGSIAGSDVRAISQVDDRKVNVEGIDNHQLTDIPIVTAAGVITTQKGPVNAIMNQYVHINHGNTIHSSAQLESFGTIVHDKAKANGGHQCLITQGGYVVPLNVHCGLVYMDMCPPTDEELNGDKQFPQIILISDLE